MSDGLTEMERAADREAEAARLASGWMPIETAKRDDEEVLILLRCGSICSAWFARGEWSGSTPDYPAEYSGDAWVCCDDRFSIEVEDMGEHGYDDGEVTHWMNVPAAPGEIA